MITAVDTSVLLDVFLADGRYGERSKAWLREAYDAGAIVVCDIVYAELVPAFRDRSILDRALREINATTSPVDTAIAYDAGLRWMRYRQAGGPRKRIISDFLIGAHAVAVAETFLTRDRGFYATYFPELTKP
ncbi:MAG: type II toxin-antitoxin system VapC family toxin [Gammaproteobacteria bacterium]|nr:type II toxin-antitoxin system VapC family toxin [Gammaproteobacteria bacterium]